MGIWEQVVTNEQREKYNELLRKSDKAYKTANIEGLNRLLSDRKGVAFVYTETLPANFKILLLITPSNDGTPKLKIVNAVPLGEFDHAEALKTAWSKVREVLDAKGVQDIYGTPVKDYDDPKINKFFEYVPDYIWEFVSEENSTNNKYCYVFKRTADRKNEDSLFKGPGRN